MNGTSWIQKLFALRQSRALETLSHGVTRQRRSLSPVYNAVTSPTLYKAEAEVLYRTVVVYEKMNRSLVFSGSRKIPTLGSTVQWETWQASFPTGTVGPRVGIFLSPLNTNDGFYLSHMGENNGNPDLVYEKRPKPTCSISEINWNIEILFVFLFFHLYIILRGCHN